MKLHFCLNDDDSLSEADIDNIAAMIDASLPGATVAFVTVSAPDDTCGCDVIFEAQSIPFERIRRITGYLSGTLDTWNDAKRAEERDRVKHDLDEIDDVAIAFADEPADTIAARTIDKEEPL